MLFSSELLNPIKLWASENYTKFKPNGFGRQHAILQQWNPPKEVWQIKEAIVNHYSLQGARQEPTHKDFCGYITEGGAVQKHTDSNFDGLIHTRFNVLISKPIDGGEPVLNDVVQDIAEGQMWRCNAGLVEHSCTPVVGSKPRIILSFGFLL